MVIFKDLLYKNPIGKNKNGNYSYNFSSDNYNAGLCGSGHVLTASFAQGDPNYDGVRKNMGEPWMMFTKEQVQELINNTKTEWTSINSVNVRKFISKTDSSKYIYLPAGGYWGSITHYSVGEFGWYWSTSYCNTAVAYNITFGSNILHQDHSSRYLGFSIRPIRPWPR